MLPTDLHIIFWAVLGAFTLGAAILATLTVVKVVRLRNVRLSWKAGKLRGYPLFSTLFLFSALLVGGIAAYRGSMEELIAAGLYTWLGVCWFATSFFATKRYVTDHGIVKNVNEPSQTVAWHQIRDFVEKREGGNTRYIFIYGSPKQEQSSSLVRLELDVPDGETQNFQKLVSHKLGRRIRCYVDEDINVQQFNNR